MDGSWGEIEILYSIHGQLIRLKKELDSKSDDIVGKQELLLEYQKIYREYLNVYLDLDVDSQLMFSEIMYGKNKNKKDG